MAFPSATAPAASVPIRLPCTRLLLPVLTPPRTNTPLSLLCEMTLPAPNAVPPMVLLRRVELDAVGAVAEEVRPEADHRSGVEGRADSIALDQVARRPEEDADANPCVRPDQIAGAWLAR